MGPADVVALDWEKKSQSDLGPVLRSLFICGYACSFSGENISFWTDRRIHGYCLHDLALSVFKSIPPRLMNKRTVPEAYHELTWVTDIPGALGWHGLAEYLQLWYMISDIALNDIEDAHLWRFESSGIFCTRSAYHAFFIG